MSRDQSENPYDEEVCPMAKSHGEESHGNYPHAEQKTFVILCGAHCPAQKPGAQKLSVQSLRCAQRSLGGVLAPRLFRYFY